MAATVHSPPISHALNALLDSMTAVPNNPRRAYWLKTLHQWHWISSAICLLGMLLFSFTGITLNHSSQIDARPAIVNKKAQLPQDLMSKLAELAAQNPDQTPALPAELQSWVSNNLSVDIGHSSSEWSEREIYLSMQRPGGDAWMSISLRNGGVKYQSTDRGWIAYLNDLHKGRYTGTAWAWFIDLFAVACVIFSITGLFILKMHANNRPSTWPLVGLGVLIPVLLAILFIH